MKLNDLREWIKEHIDALNLTHKIQYIVGRFVATDYNKNDILISIKQLGGTNRPPFLRYNRYKIHIISGQIFMSPEDETGNDIDYSEDDPMVNFGVNPTHSKPQYVTDGVWEEGEIIANAIEIASDGLPPCGAIGIKLLSSKAGPLYLDDGRIYYTLDLEVII